MNQHTDQPATSNSAEWRPWQFGLAHLFGLTTWASVAAALVAVCGPGTLTMSAGLLLAWLNYCGAFASLQSGRRQTAVLWAAWGLFLISLTLPSMPPVFGTNSIYGFEAAYFVLGAPLNIWNRGSVVDLSIPWLLLMDAANLLMLLTPLLIWRIKRGGGQWLGVSLCVAMVSTWIVTWDGAMLIGYFVWVTSMLFVLVAVPLRLKTLMAMVVTAAALVVMLKWGALWGPTQ
jgi:hypothetical protein